MQPVRPTQSIIPNAKKPGLPKEILHDITSFLLPPAIGSMMNAHRYFNVVLKQNPVWMDKLSNAGRKERESDGTQTAYDMLKKSDSNRLNQYRSMNFFATSEYCYPRRSNYIVTCMKKGWITFQEIYSADFNRKARILDNPNVQKYINNDKLPFRMALRLGINEIDKLDCPIIQKYIDNNKLDLTLALKLTHEQIVHLGKPCVQNEIDRNGLSLSVAINITPSLNTMTQKLSLLNDQNIQKHIANGLLTPDEACELRNDSVVALSNCIVQKYIKNGKLLFSDAIKLTPLDLIKLNNLILQKRVDDGELTLSEALEIPMATIRSWH